MQGLGNLQRQDRITSKLVLQPIISIGPPPRVMLRFDGHELNLDDAMDAALDLAPVVTQVRADHVAKGMRAWIGVEPTVE